MKMLDGLPRMVSTVGDDAEAISRKPLLCGDLSNDFEHMGNRSGIICIHMSGGWNMLLGNHQDMHGRLGIDIVEGQNAIVFIDLFRGDFSSDDFTKQAVVHTQFLLPLFRVLCDKIIDHGQCVVKLERVIAACHCAVRLAAAVAACDLGDRAH